MRLTLEDKPKLEMFVALFQLLKNWNSSIDLRFSKNHLFIQAMDPSHVCLSNIKIPPTWFSTFDCPVSQCLTVNTVQLATLLHLALKQSHSVLEMKCDDGGDKLLINFLSTANATTANATTTTTTTKSTYDHFFELNLMDACTDLLEIPATDYEVEFTIETKKFVDTLVELNTFGQDLNVSCLDDYIEMEASGESTKLTINIPIDDLLEYATTENTNTKTSFSLTHLCKMCLSTKLSNQLKVRLSNEYPLTLGYELGDPNSLATFFLAPKIND